jgi:hypothetical protein
MEYCSGQRVNLWYNIKPMHTTNKNPFGSKITFSPLFAICNHLPFDLTMVATETNPTGPAPISLPECVLGGEGERTILCGLQASTWYHLSFRQSGSVSVSEPTVSLSTFLLVHLPFSTVSEEQGEHGEKQWPYEDEDTQAGPSAASMTSSVRLMLPLEDGSRCSLHAVLERDPVNTISLHLQPDVLLVNRCPITVQAVTRSPEETEEEERDGEVVSTLSPNDVGLLSQNKFLLLTEMEGKTLVSQPLIACGEKERDQQQQPTNVILTESESSRPFGAFGNLTLVRRLKGAMNIISIVPTYTFHNNTSHDLQVSTTLFHPDTNRPNRDPLVVECVPSRTTKPLVFWEHRNMEGSGETVQALGLRTLSEGTRWSLPLSPDFVRHSFALPTSDDKYLRAVLTMHEHSSTVYMVVTEDPAPRLLIQNHSQLCLEVVEAGARGIHGFPQSLPPAQEVAYEPPTYAKQYPIVFDGEMGGGEGAGGNTRKKLAQVAVKFRVVQEPSESGERDEEEDGVEREWSGEFHLSSDSDRLLSVPRAESLLVSTHRRGITLHLSLLPTGQAAGPLYPTLSLTNCDDVSLKSRERDLQVRLDLRIEQLVICMDDEVTEDWKSIDEVLQIVFDGAVLQFSDVGREGKRLELTLESFHVNNMTEKAGGDFAATVIPRAHHQRRASLIESEPTPIASLSVNYNPHSSNLIDSLRISFQPLTLQLEDGLLNRLKCVFKSYSTPGTLLSAPSVRKKSERCVVIPEAVLAESERDVVPVAVTKLVIDPASFYLNARISLRVLLSCNDSPFRFSRYQLCDIYSNWTELSQTVASRYILSTIAHVGWLVGSLELIGSPGTFIQNVGRGLRDLVTLPYQGLTRSPTWFLMGIGQGTMSFVHHLSSGALGSVTSMASSISHNMERLSLDPHHVAYQTRQRQERPTTHLSMGLVSGASSLGLSLMSAVAGIVEQPMQSYHQMEGPTSPALAAQSILKGVGKGLLGAVTKPVGGVMELVSQTGQGLMHGTGLARRLPHKTVKLKGFTGCLIRATLPCSSTACAIKLGGDSLLLLSSPVNYVTPNGQKQPAQLLVTHEKIYLLDATTNSFLQTFSIAEHSLEECDSGAGNLEEIEIEIVANSSKSTEGASFQKVEYFLQQSCGSRSVESMAPPKLEQLAASPSLDWSDPDLEQPETYDHSLTEERAGVRLLIPTHHAVQLVSFFNSLSQILTVRPRAVFCVHRTFKSESFVSATSH